jgi:hypothetical protein
MLLAIHVNESGVEPDVCKKGSATFVLFQGCCSALIGISSFAQMCVSGHINTKLVKPAVEQPGH